MILAVGVSAIAGFSFFLHRRTAKSLEANNQKQFADAPPYRSLFEPDDEEIRSLEREEIERAEIQKQAAAQNVLTEKENLARRFQTVWRENPTVQSTIELFRLAALTESAKIFSETAQSVLQVWRENKIKNLTARNLADLLDSHVAALSQQERASGAAFWLKQETAALRREDAR